jgi:hypothetical protein
MPEISAQDVVAALKHTMESEASKKKTPHGSEAPRTAPVSNSNGVSLARTVYGIGTGRHIRESDYHSTRVHKIKKSSLEAFLEATLSHLDSNWMDTELILSDADPVYYADETQDKSVDYEVEQAKIMAQIELVFVIVKYFNLDYEKLAKALKCQDLYYKDYDDEDEADDLVWA